MAQIAIDIYFSSRNAFLKLSYSCTLIGKILQTNNFKVVGSKKIKWHKQDSQNLGASKSNGINRIAKIWEQVNQMA